MALCCNICAIVKYVIALLAAVALVVVYFTVGFAWLTGVTDKLQCHQQCTENFNGDMICTLVCSYSN